MIGSVSPTGAGLLFPPLLRSAASVGLAGGLPIVAWLLYRREPALTDDELRGVQLNLWTVVAAVTGALLALQWTRSTAVGVGIGSIVGTAAVSIASCPHLAAERARIVNGDRERLLVGWAMLGASAVFPVMVATELARQLATWLYGSVVLVALGGLGYTVWRIDKAPADQQQQTANRSVRR